MPEDAELEEVVSGLLVSSSRPDILARIRDNTYSEEFMGRVADALAERLGGEDQEAAKQAAFALGALGDARAAPILMGLLQSEDPMEVRAAAGMLAKIGEQGAVTVLVDILENSERPRMRYEAARALGAFGNADAVEPLLDLLERWDARPRQKAAAAASLGMIANALGEQLGEETRQEIFNALEALCNSNDVIVLRGAITGLGLLGDPEAADTLIKYVQYGYQYGEGVQGRAIVALARVTEANGGDYPGDIPEYQMDNYARPLEEALQSENAVVRRSAALLLGAIGSTGSVGALIGLLQNGEEGPGVRAAAAWALGNFTGEDAIEALVDASMDGSEAVRASARASLERIPLDEEFKKFEHLYYRFWDEILLGEGGSQEKKEVIATALATLVETYGVPYMAQYADYMYPGKESALAKGVISLLQSEDADMRRSAAILLGAMPDISSATAWQALQARLEMETDETDPGGGVRQAINTSMERLSSGTRVAARH